MWHLESVGSVNDKLDWSFFFQSIPVHFFVHQQTKQTNSCFKSLPPSADMHSFSWLTGLATYYSYVIVLLSQNKYVIIHVFIHRIWKRKQHHPPLLLVADFLLCQQVRFLEQQNKMLETKWKLLQEQTTSHSNIDAMFEAYIANLRKQLENLGHEKVKLESDLHHMTGQVEDFKKKWVKQWI